MRWTAALAASLVLASPAGAHGFALQSASAPRISGNPASPASARSGSAASLERSVLVAINDVRRRSGLTPLRSNRELAVAARGHSLSMAERGYFSHSSYDGSPFWERIKPLYGAVPGRTWEAGENMVWRSPNLTAGQAIQLWLESPPHRKNLLAPSWRDVGIGVVHALAAPGVFDGLDVTIVTVDFGVR